MIPSNVALRLIKRPKMRTRSPRTVQQMQPLFISKISSWLSYFRPLFWRTSSSSIPTSPNSFSMIASFLPWFSLRMRFSRVVLPEPRKPVMSVTESLPTPSEAVIVVEGCACECVLCCCCWLLAKGR